MRFKVCDYDRLMLHDVHDDILKKMSEQNQRTLLFFLSSIEASILSSSTLSWVTQSYIKKRSTNKNFLIYDVGKLRAVGV